MRLRKGIALLLTMMLLVLAGCQSIGGVDLSGFIQKSAEVKSGETHSVVGLSLQVRPEAELTKEEQEIIAIFNGISLDVTTKTDIDNGVSVKGTVSWDNKVLPFQATVDKQLIVATVEGAKAPIVIPFDEDDELGNITSSLLPNSADAEKLQKSMLTFFTKHAPNFKDTTVSSVQEPVFGQSESLNKVHIEIRANDVLEWVSGLLTSVVADEAGTKAFLKEMNPIITSLMELEAVEGEDVPVIDEESAEEFANVGYADLKDSKDEIIAEMEAAWKEAQDPASEYATLFGDKTNMKLDLFVDYALNMKKMNMELNVALPELEDNPIEGFQIQVMTEMRKHNEAIQLDTIDATNGINLMEQTLTPGQWLRNFDSKSTMHQLLKDTGITNKFLVISLIDEEYGEWISDYPLPYVDNGVTMVSLRYVAEQLDADVKWMSKSKQVRIVDDITEQVIVMTIGSKQATVDGKVVTLSAAPSMKNGSTVYIPLRNIAELLGAEVRYEQSEYGSYATVERP